MTDDDCVMGVENLDSFDIPAISLAAAPLQFVHQFSFFRCLSIHRVIGPSRTNTHNDDSDGGRPRVPPLVCGPPPHSRRAGDRRHHQRVRAERRLCLRQPSSLLHCMGQAHLPPHHRHREQRGHHVVCKHCGARGPLLCGDQGRHRPMLPCREGRGAGAGPNGHLWVLWGLPHQRRRGGAGVCVVPITLAQEQQVPVQLGKRPLPPTMQDR
mmetsp:Transcript_22942/g.56686  ORF Transcript_22942/g.56686 Transcript_22942/m.56686 type:complete len:211 (-) Transcript_22942:558-1190(-)